MVCSRVSGLLAITLCLLTCFCATAESAGAATQAVNEAREKIKQVLKKAEENLVRAKNLLLYAGSSKEYAKEAASSAAKAAEGNPEAQLIAQKAHDAFKQIETLYPEFANLAKKTVSDMENHLSEAETLHNMVRDDTLSGKSSENDYKGVKSTSEKVKAKAKTLDEEINNTASLIDNTKATGEIMSTLLNDAWLEESQVKAFLTFAKSNSLLKEAQSYESLINANRNAMNVDIVHLKKLYENTSMNLTNHIESLYHNAEQVVSMFSRVSEKVNQLMTEIHTVKAKIDDAYSNVKNEKEFMMAKRHAHDAQMQVVQLERKVKDVKKVLESVRRYAENANQYKVYAVNIIKENNPEQDVDFVTETLAPSEEDETRLTSAKAPESSLNMETTQRTTTKSNQQGHGSSDKVMHKGSDRSINESTSEPKTDHSVQSKNTAAYISKRDKSDGEKVETLTQEKKLQPQKSLTDTVMQHAQGGTKVKVIKESVLAGNLLGHGAELGDTAVTVSVSLVLALIACAAMY